MVLPTYLQSTIPPNCWNNICRGKQKQNESVGGDCVRWRRCGAADDGDYGCNDDDVGGWCFLCGCDVWCVPGFVVLCLAFSLDGWCSVWILLLALVSGWRLTVWLMSFLKCEKAIQIWAGRAGRRYFILPSFGIMTSDARTAGTKTVFQKGRYGSTYN